MTYTIRISIFPSDNKDRITSIDCEEIPEEAIKQEGYGAEAFLGPIVQELLHMQESLTEKT